MQMRQLDHVQLAMPSGREDEARAYFLDLLGMTEVPKPSGGAGPGGCWFQAGEVHLHLGADPDFRPARKAHPAIVVDDLASLITILTAAGVEVEPGGDLPGRTRVFADDPFGNRIEWIELEGTR